MENKIESRIKLEEKYIMLINNESYKNLHKLGIDLIDILCLVEMSCLSDLSKKSDVEQDIHQVAQEVEGLLLDVQHIVSKTISEMISRMITKYVVSDH